MIRRLGRLVALVTVALLLAQGMAVAEKAIPRDLVIPTLETSLQQLSQLAQGNLPEAQAFGANLGVTQSSGLVRVTVETKGYLSDVAVSDVGGKVISRAIELGLVAVDIPPSCLVALAELPGVRFVRRPFRPMPLAVSEGITVSGVGSWHSAGINGEGIKVAIIDGEFAGMSRAIASGALGNVIYTHDYAGGGLETNGVHGTACAEIVHEMAPDAQLILLKIGTAVDLSNAVDDAIAQGASIISHSMGWFNTNFYDGTGQIAQIASRAVSHGILWVNSAGNSADGGHWEGNWVDADNDGWLDFSSGDEQDNFTLEAGETVSVFLTWNAWPSTDQDYDLYLLDAAGNEVSSSTEYQTGIQSPEEWLTYTSRAGGVYGIAIYGHDAPDHPRLELFAMPYTLPMEYYVAASSIPAPGNAPFVFTIGAIDWRDWTSGPQEAFSSQGPTNASRYAASITKPDICGPDGTTSPAYGDNFHGTSASAPHVAGAGALVWSAHPTWSAENVRQYLQNNAIDMGSVGKDNIYGYGRLNLSTQPTNSPGPSSNTHTYGATAGWYMVSVAGGGSAATLFGLNVYTYGPVVGKYVVATNIEPYKGYWAYLPANKSVTDHGTKVTNDVTIDASTAGWYQISSPWSYPKSAIQVTWEYPTCGGTRKETKLWADAVSAGWVRDQIYGYVATDGAYTTPTMLDPWYGYWMKALVSGLSLKLLYASGTPVSALAVPMVAPKAIVLVPADLPAMPPSAPTVAMLGLTFGNSPNPVTDVHTTIFAVKGAGAALVSAVKVEIYDLAGTLVYESGEVAGTSLAWHTNNDYGQYLANGVYQYKMYAKVQGQWVVSVVKPVVILR